MATLPGMIAPDVRSATNRGRVNVPGMAGAVWWPLFDRQTVTAAAAAQQTFFSVPIGSAGKTETDTNMELSGQIPAGRRFVITGIGLDFFAGVDVAQTGAAAALNAYANDVHAFFSSGRLKLTIGSKDYCNHGPLMRFPSVNRLDFDTSVAMTGTDQSLTNSYGTAVGRGFVTMDTVLMANQNFSVTIFDRAALPSTSDGSLYVSLYGWLYRNAQ